MIWIAGHLDSFGEMKTCSSCRSIGGPEVEVVIVLPVFFVVVSYISSEKE
jgi:hypothetical protein